MQKRPSKKKPPEALKSFLSATKLGILLPNIISRSNFDLTGKGSSVLFSENYSPRSVSLYNKGRISPPYLPFKQKHNTNSVQLFYEDSVVNKVKKRASILLALWDPKHVEMNLTAHLLMIA